MTNTAALAAAALARLRHSVHTSAGMHKLQLRRKAAQLRNQEPACTPATPSMPQ
jgi:hypothetical protein